MVTEESNSKLQDLPHSKILPDALKEWFGERKNTVVFSKRKRASPPRNSERTEAMVLGLGRVDVD